MRFKVGMTHTEKVVARARNEREAMERSQWHPFYCLFPRRIGHLLVWLEWIERKEVEGYDGYCRTFYWEYRTPDQAEHPMNEGAQ